MADAAEIAEAAAARRPGRKLGLSSALVGALALGGGGFYAVYAGLLDPPASSAAEAAADTAAHGDGHGEAAARSACSATWPSWRWTRS